MGDSVDELRRELENVSVRVEYMETRFVGLNEIIDLRLMNLQDKIEARDGDRAELLNRIKDLEKQVSSVSVDIAKLLGKWSIVTLIVAGLLSVTISGITEAGVRLPEVLPPKAEVSWEVQDDW